MTHPTTPQAPCLPDEIERLAKEATAEPWTAEEMNGYVIVVQPDDSGGPIAEFNGLPGKDCEANAALIVYLRNHASTIVTALRAAATAEGKLEEGRKALEFCQIVCPPSPGQHGTYDADTGRMFRDLLAKERQALDDANRKANAAQILNSNQRQMLDAQRRTKA